MIFSWKDSVPSAYVEQSRDFQLLCNSFDLVQNAVKFDIDSITQVSDSRLCPDSLLSHLQQKLGFYTSYRVPSDQLRVILSAFPYIVKNKGVASGLLLAVKTFLKCCAEDVYCMVAIDNTQYQITFSLNSTPRDLTLLKDLLSYVIPAGYVLRFAYYTRNTTEDGSVFESTLSNELRAIVTQKFESYSSAQETYPVDESVIQDADRDNYRVYVITKDGITCMNESLGEDFPYVASTYDSAVTYNAQEAE